MKRFLISLSLLFIFTLGAAWAQQDSTKNYRVAQATILPPLSTDNLLDLDPLTTTHSYSFNMFFGKTGGLKGMELGGVGNVILGKTEGVQFAGVFNYTGNELKGAQLAGGVNILNAEGKGAQIGGVNVAREELNGIQIGVVNHGTTVKGVQFGLINIADSIKGAPIGLLSFIKSGYNAFEVGSTEVFSGEVTYRLGADGFYNLFSLGFKSEDGYDRYGVGYGFGTQFRMGKKNKIFLEGMAYQINEDEVWTDDLNLLSRLNLGVDIRVFPWMSIAQPLLECICFSSIC
ncbi:hypothetical protein V6R21_09490 [Limibacter armeniacum]|uniref:LA_2272 family surface repeat-containing protein n=1 Tax=Limibacter armeniacum TaxID=466084 RepID=UPI002FE622BA